ncbi:HAMP domain-containing histidine kinase [Gracilibacillus caseinilyticus]|uniref:histidine kinase n=1 Tax=Gracilibacillus caseinilyticus TaxID=2932256 RepID=A0ABY4F0R6_9BACI|nr:HAMP domain-containing sensor histidine kinase [Gracilibacillus caseinilyticus]UOQ49682.1 HAMP domain-containing histidine kinase [Gracilibacillus caseinilyticus]
MKTFFRSLLAKYMMIIILAISLVQIGYLFIALFITGVSNTMDSPYTEEETDLEKLEEAWHQEASHLNDISSNNIAAHFAKWKDQYPDAAMFWVDGQGKLREQLDVSEDLPNQWNSSYTAKFIKERYDDDPFTVIAFIGNDQSNGFIVFEINRAVLQPPAQLANDRYGVYLLAGIALLILLFICISFLFFRGIRKRLLQLQEAMEIRDVDGLPIQIDVKKKDEIGQLEQTFNQMVDELRDSREREQEEERLRQELIANLSHDLRTPLTKINAQTFKLAKKDLPKDAVESLKTLKSSVANIDRLIENLMSYTLLMASKYKLDLQEIDIVRFTRECIASWYPVFEKEDFDIEADIQDFENNRWLVDPIWLNRIYDNLFQNVLRHAKHGKYVAIRLESADNYDAIVISDHGKGMIEDSEQQGAGIGLSIVDKMVKGMDLEWDIDSNEQGTTIKIKRYK